MSAALRTRYSVLALLLAAYACLWACSGPAPRNNPGAGSLSFAFSGDLAGQNVCRDRQLGFPIFNSVLARRPQFFVALGDMIYADDVCQAVGRYGNAQVPHTIGIAASTEDFRAHWRYVQSDRGFARLLQDLPYYAVWDDHEVRNDFWPATAAHPHGTDPGLIASSRAVFAALHPPDADPLYYRRAFGRHLEMFFLDTRSYRSSNDLPDTAGAAKSMLGKTQFDWLVAGISGSAATWKVVVSSVPLSIPTGWPPEGSRDGWASGSGDTGFERELDELLRNLARAGVTNLLFITADVHFATGFRYQPFLEFPGFEFHELVTGPLSAGLFPTPAVDTTFAPQRLFFYGPPDAAAIQDFATARRWFNFGLIAIDGEGVLSFQLVDGFGTTRQRLSFLPR